MSRGQVSFLGKPSATAAYFESVGRPLSGVGGGGGGVDSAAGSVGVADAMLDVIGNAEMAEDGGERGQALLVVMSRNALLKKVGLLWE